MLKKLKKAKNIDENLGMKKEVPLLIRGKAQLLLGGCNMIG